MFGFSSVFPVLTFQILNFSPGWPEEMFQMVSLSKYIFGGRGRRGGEWG